MGLSSFGPFSVPELLICLFYGEKGGFILPGCLALRQFMCDAGKAGEGSTSVRHRARPLKAGWHEPHGRQQNKNRPTFSP